MRLTVGMPPGVYNVTEVAFQMLPSNHSGAAREQVPRQHPYRARVEHSSPRQQSIASRAGLPADQWLSGGRRTASAEIDDQDVSLPDQR